MNVTTYDIAQALGVSQATVSRALNDSREISTQLKEKIAAKAVEMGYVCNHLAKTLITGHSSTIGLLVSGLHVDVTGYNMMAMDTEIRSRGYQSYIAYTLGEPEIMANKALDLFSRGIDGLIVWNDGIFQDQDGLAAYQRLLNTHRPLVVISHVRQKSIRGSRITLTSERAYREAFNFLHSRVKNQIFAVWRLPLNGQTQLDYRYQIIAQELKRHDLAEETQVWPVAESILPPLLNSSSAQLALEQCRRMQNFLYRYRGQKIGLICHNDMVALQIQLLAQEIGFRLNQDLFIVGFNNSLIGIYSVPQLTTIGYDPRVMAQQAFDLLNSQLSGDNSDKIVSLEADFVQRLDN